LLIISGIDFGFEERAEYLCGSTPSIRLDAFSVALPERFRFIRRTWFLILSRVEILLLKLPGLQKLLLKSLQFRVPSKVEETLKPNLRRAQVATYCRGESFEIRGK
jgi:hypothetical protein